MLHGMLGLRIEQVAPLYQMIDHATSNAGEALAMLAATLWIGQTPPGTPARITADSKIVLAAAQRQSFPHMHPRLMEALDAVTRCVECTHDVSYDHINSHIGHPWNELADAVAEEAARGQKVGAMPQVFRSLQNRACEAWAWLDVAAPQFVRRTP